MRAGYAGVSGYGQVDMQLVAAKEAEMNDRRRPENAYMRASRNQPVQYVHDMLMRWASWQKDGGPACMGYADHSPYVVVKREAGEAYDPDESMRIDAAVARLPRKQKLAVVCYYVHAHGYDDAAERLHTNAATLRSRVYAAQRALDQDLSAIETQFSDMR